MRLHFNTTGPVFSGKHYRIDPMKRIDWEDMQFLIDNEKYFVLHAPRQTGKTSTLLSIMEVLNQQGDYHALYVNLEGAQAAREDAAIGMTLIASEIASRARDYGITSELQHIAEAIIADNIPLKATTELLSRWAQVSDKPIVLLLDEVDTLVGDTLISLLRQIRVGYTQRPHAFPQSIILCGVRDVRDYRIETPNKETITGGSAFNIKAESLRLGNLNIDEIKQLYQQHTELTQQVFKPEVFTEVWQDTEGQPWLVNALGHEMTWQDKAARDRSTPITLERYLEARHRIIRSGATHLDQLKNQLKDRRVHGVITTLLTGENILEHLDDDDLQYVEDLGLIVRKPQIRIANAIYKEIIPRNLTRSIQDRIPHQQAWYLTPERRLDIPKLIENFQQFYRENADIWLQGLPYKEAAPHLILQAFLQRIVNGGGRIHREYALGRKFTDVYVEWPLDEEKGFYGEIQRIVIELKIFRYNLDETIAQCLDQVIGYAKQCGADEAYVIVFNPKPEVSWDNKIWHQNHVYDGFDVGVWGA